MIIMMIIAMCRELNYFASFDMHDVNDPQYFSYVPAFAIVDFILNIPCYLIMGIVLLLTYAPVRTQAGSTRRVAPKSVGCVGGLTGSVPVCHTLFFKFNLPAVSG